MSNNTFQWTRTSLAPELGYGAIRMKVETDNCVLDIDSGLTKRTYVQIEKGGAAIWDCS